LSNIIVDAQAPLLQSFCLQFHHRPFSIPLLSNSSYLRIATMSTPAVPMSLEEVVQVMTPYFNQVIQRFDRVDARLDRIEGRLDGVEERLGLVGRLSPTRFQLLAHNDKNRHFSSTI
jgi:hypothetical protein